ncbi:hypothetical protein [Paenibacillus hamazuiensis]|uniref:hypothetical protein n=1 Tax=Paenibacillus hamazuiensis TaxID=2936508 RepID=UPI00200EA112|nr:hypothetical protein [Paenibacillus hamazuiensis]
MADHTNITRHQPEVEVIMPDKSKQSGLDLDSLKQEALKHLVGKIPDAISTIEHIARTYSDTKNSIALLEKEGYKMLLEADAYVKKAQEDRLSDKQRGDLIIQVMEKANEILTNANVPEAAKGMYAANLHVWMTALISKI